MVWAFVRKASVFCLCLFLIFTFSFFLMKALPGDPFSGDQVVPEEVLQNLYAHFGLDQPLWKQYLRYLQGCLTLDLGPSLIYSGRGVREIILEGFFISARLGVQAFLFSLTLGSLFGIFSALQKGKRTDIFPFLVTTLGLSLPNFVIATLLQYFLAIWWPIFPIATWRAPYSSFLPSLALSFMPMAYIARVIRSALLEILEQDYILLAKAKGLSPSTILFRHALPSAFIPILGFLGPLAAYFLTGSFIVEKIFAIPGLGQWTVSSILQRDYTTIMGLILFFSILLFSTVFFTDLIRAWLSPRIKLGRPRET